MLFLFICQFTAGVFFLTLFLGAGMFFLRQILLFTVVLGAYVFVKKEIKKGIGVSLAGVGLAIIIVFSAHYRLQSQQVKSKNEHTLEGMIVGGKPGSVYIFETNLSTYFLRDVDERFNYGQKLIVGGRVSTVDETLFVSLFSDQSPLVFGIFNYDTRRWAAGIRGDIYDPKITTVDIELEEGNTLLSIKSFIVTTSQQIFGDVNGALLSGILIGDISYMTKEVYDSFVSSGLVHLVAVSGGNLLFIGLLCACCFFFLPFYYRLFFVCLSVTYYSFLVGLDSSVFRSLVMFLLISLSLFIGRSGSLIRNLQYAWLILLCLNPFVLHYDLGFILSFSAIVGIMVASKWHGKATKKTSLFSNFISKYIIPTLGASFGVMPVLLFYVGSFNILGIIGNVIIIPFIPFIMIGGLLSIAGEQYLFGEYLQLLVSFLLKFVHSVSSYTSVNGIYIGSEELHVLLSVSILFFYFLCIIISYFIISTKKLN